MKKKGPLYITDYEEVATISGFKVKVRDGIWDELKLRKIHAFNGTHVFTRIYNHALFNNSQALKHFSKALKAAI